MGISNDPWILETVNGHHLELAYTPRQRVPPRQRSLSGKEQALVSEEVVKLIAKQAIREVTEATNQFVSELFLVPKKDGSQRPVVNLKPLNRFIKRQKFKMEGAKVIRDLLQKGDWMTSIDLRDAYLSVPVAQEDRRYLRFRWRETLFEFQCLPFGLSSAPRVFTKLLKPVVALLRARGIRCILFLDDMLVMDQTIQGVKKASHEIVSLLQVLGFQINWEKSVLTPTQVIQYLGLMVDSRLMTLSLPANKLEGIVQSCRTAHKKSFLSIREIARLIGRMTATALAVLPAPLCYRNLQQLKNHALLTEEGYDAKVRLNRGAKQELQWWAQELPKWNGRPIHPPPPDLTIETDASLLGWGAVANGVCTGGLWSEEERQSHINQLEMLGAALAVQCYARSRAVSHVHLRMDNQAAVCYVNHMGGTRSPSLSMTACQLWEWCLQQGIILSAEYLPGSSNVTADRESRVLQSSAEWMLNKRVFMEVMNLYGQCRVDLFASRLNNQLPLYVSWRPDPYAMATDAFQIRWTGLEAYAFPPFALIGRCLQKIRQESSTVVLIAPVWPTQVWYPWLLKMLVHYPTLLPIQKTLLQDPFNRDHPLLVKKQLQLAAWKVSGVSTLSQAFQAELRRLSQQDGGRGPTQPTSQAGLNGVAGVIRGLSIPFHAISSIS